MGFRFLFWQGLSISRSCACSPTDAPSVTDIELLSASSSSSFQANKFIHLVLCWLLLHRQVVKKKKGGGVWRPVRPSHFGLVRWRSLRGRKRKAGTVNDLDLHCFLLTVGWRCNVSLSGSCSYSLLKQLFNFFFFFSKTQLSSGGISVDLCISLNFETSSPICIIWATTSCCASSELLRTLWVASWLITYHNWMTQCMNHFTVVAKRGLGCPANLNKSSC